MLNKLLQYPKTLAFFGGSLAVTALPPYYFFPILFLSLSGLLLLVIKASTHRQAFNIGYAFGFGFFAFGLSWIGNALLIDAETFGCLYPVVFLACGAFFGLFIALPCWLSSYCKNVYCTYVSLCSWWVIFEWLRSFILTGFPWNLLGSSLAFNLELIQLAAIGGTYLLSYLCLIICMAPALAISGHNCQSRLIAFGIILGSSVFLYGYGLIHLQSRSNAVSDIVVRLVQPSIPQNMKWDSESLENNFQQYINLSQQPGLDKVDFVIWGETASPFPLDLDNAHRQQIKAAIPHKGYLVTGLVRYEFDSYGNYQPLNSMFVLNDQAEIEDYYDKFHLVPFGEYIPLRQYLPSWIRPITKVIGNFKSGIGPKKINIANYPAFGSLICYEVIFPHKIINKQNRPDWIINLTNDGWYGDSSGPHQHLVTTRLRAVEEGITIVRAANSGISAVVSPFGEAINSLPLNIKSTIDVKLPMQLQLVTPYSIAGNILILFWCFFNIILAIYFSSRNLGIHQKKYI